MNKRTFFADTAPAYLLAAVLALSPLLRFSWDLWSQTLLHVALAAALVLFLTYREPGFRILPHGSLVLLLAGACCSLWRNPDAAQVRNELLVLFDSLVACYLFSTLPLERRRILLRIPVFAGFFFSVILAFFALTSYHGGYLEPEAIVNPNVIAGYLALACPLSFALWDKYGRPGSAISAFIFAGILLTHSRTAMLFSAAAAAIFLWQRGGRSRRVIAVAAPLLLAAFVYAMSLKAGQDSLGSRLLWGKTAVQMFIAHPVNGTGWGNFGSLFPVYKAGEGLNTLYAHNLFLQVLAEGGLLAVIPFCALLCAFFILRGGPEPAHRAFRLPLYLSAVSFLAMNLFDYGFSIPALMLLFFSVLGATVPGGSAVREKPAVPAWGSAAVIVALAVLFLVPLQANRRYGHALYFLKQNDPARAEQALAAARRLDPMPYRYYSTSAETAFMRYAQSKDPSALQLALVRQRQALDRFPESGELWADLSWLYLVAGDREQAAAAMRTAAAHDRTSPRYRRALASFGTADHVH